VGREAVSDLVQYLRTQMQASHGNPAKKKFSLTPELEIVSLLWWRDIPTKRSLEYFKISEDTVEAPLEQHLRQAWSLDDAWN
jgi:hypothetical protein